MEEKIESRASAEKVWAGWAHMHSGQGSSGKFRYRIIDLVPEERFTMVWKSLFIRLLLTYSVYPIGRGSEVGFEVKVKGPFAWATRWILLPKVQKQLREALRMFVRKLEG